jgi:hypothetical protein
MRARIASTCGVFPALARNVSLALTVVDKEPLGWRERASKILS